MLHRNQKVYLPRPVYKHFKGIIAYTAPNQGRTATRKQLFFKKKTCLIMDEEAHYITNKRKTAQNEWENGDSDFLRALYSVYKN